mgnify:CR=1 FL=1
MHGEFFLKGEGVGSGCFLFALVKLPHGIIKVSSSCGFANSCQKSVEDVSLLLPRCDLLPFIGKWLRVLFLFGSF